MWINCLVTYRLFISRFEYHKRVTRHILIVFEVLCARAICVYVCTHICMHACVYARACVCIIYSFLLHTYTHFFFLLDICVMCVYICIYNICNIYKIFYLFCKAIFAFWVELGQSLFVYLCLFYFVFSILIHFKYCKNSHAFVRTVPHRHLITSQLCRFLNMHRWSKTYYFLFDDADVYNTLYSVDLTN